MTYAVVRLITRLNIGGPARQALILTRELADQYPTYLAAGRPDPSEGELRDPAVTVHDVPLVRPVQPAQDARAARAVHRVLREVRPRVLHTHMAKAGSVGRSAAIALGRDRPKLVHTFHGHVLEGDFNPAVQRAFVEAERMLARRTDVLVAVSPQIRDQLLELRIGRPDQYRVISLGLDLDGFLAVAAPAGALRRQLGLEPAVPLVGIVGRLVPIKAVDVLLHAIASLNDVHLAVVGDGVERASLEQIARDLGIAERVHFTGWSEDVPAAMSDLDVVALTSRNEGTPVALIEALAAGRPVVATDVGGVRHVVEDGVTGLLAPMDDARVVGARIAELLADPAQGARLAAVGRERVTQRFGCGRLVADIRKLYGELIGP